MERREKTRKPWNKLLIVDLSAALLAAVCFAVSETVVDHGPYLPYQIVISLFYAAVLFLTVCVLLTPVFLWKHDRFSKPLLIVTTIVNGFSLVGIIWYVRVVLIFLYD